MKLKVIVVSPKYQMNMGYICRVSKNFGIKQLFIVNPRANLRGKKAVMYSKHGADLLRNAKIYKSLEDATRGCNMILATSGIWREMPSPQGYTLKEAISLIKKEYPKNAVIGLIIGRDDTGLRKEELEKCDMLLHIPSNKMYPSLNISHALAIVLYEFMSEGFGGYKTLPSEKPLDEELKVLMQVFDRNMDGKRIRNKVTARNAFSKMIRKSNLNRSELHAVITALK